MRIKDVIQRHVGPLNSFGGIPLKFVYRILAQSEILAIVGLPCTLWKHR